ncbi:gliding motility lipoprotein GldB [Mucilaginibacter myungsuensis]
MLASCDSGKKKVDVSHIDVDIKIERFDHDLDDMRRKPMPAQAHLMQGKYGEFYRDYMERILPLGRITDSAYLIKLGQILSTPDYQALKHETDSIYPNMDKANEQLTDAFRRIKYYFPKQQIPKVYAYISGFQTQVAIGQGYVGIGLDMFLGEKSKFYPALVQVSPHYISRRFTPDYIAPRVVETIAQEDMFRQPDEQKILLDKMIYAGKVMYFMDQVLPDVADSVKIGYTAAQMEWCKQFKAEIWGYFLEEKLLFDSDELKTQKYLGEAPFTPGLGEGNESAPRLGIWTGWQIVRQYMERNPNVTLPQLMADNDAQKILNGSKYRPEKGD